MVCVHVSAHHRRALSKGSSLSRYMPCLSSSFIGSVAEPDAATIAAETLALQWLSPGHFHSLPSALLQRGSACGLKKLMLTAFSSRARMLDPASPLSLPVCPLGMERIRAAKDHDDRTLESVTRRLDEKYLHSTTAFCTAAAFQMVSSMDSLRSLRNLPFHKMQSGAADLDTPK